MKIPLEETSHVYFKIVNSKKHTSCNTTTAQINGKNQETLSKMSGEEEQI